MEFTSGALVAAEAASRRVVAIYYFAFVVPASVNAGALVACDCEAGGGPVEDAQVFAVDEGAQVGDGHKSLMVSVRNCGAHHTPSADVVLGVRKALNEVKQAQRGMVLHWLSV